MPFVRFTYTDEEYEAYLQNGGRLVRGKSVSLEQAIRIFRVQHQLIKGTPAEQEYCKRVHKVYIARELAPADYKAKYPQIGDLLEEAQQVPLAYKD